LSLLCCCFRRWPADGTPGPRLTCRISVTSAAGVTPLMRAAAASVAGRTSFSFSLSSAASAADTARRQTEHISLVKRPY